MTMTPFPLTTAIAVIGPNAPDIFDWPKTSALEEFRCPADGSLTFRHDAAGQWPVLDGVEGNLWVIVQVGGLWLAATIEWLRPGQQAKRLTPLEYGRDQIRTAPLDETWPGPQDGEVVGYLVSAHARHGVRSVRERSNLVWCRYGEGQIGREDEAVPSPEPTSVEDALRQLTAAVADQSALLLRIAERLDHPPEYEGTIPAANIPVIGATPALHVVLTPRR